MVMKKKILELFQYIDPPLLLGISFVAMFGLLILYSAADQQMSVVYHQLLHFSVAFCGLWLASYIRPHQLLRFAPWFYGAAFLLLTAVLIMGHIGKGAQRWLGIGMLRFQPAELMKLGLPLMLAWYFHEKTLPPRLRNIVIGLLIILLPALFIAKQPDLGTALLVTMTGCGVLLLTSMRWGWLISGIVGCVASAPVLWHFMHDYQRQRILTFLNPEHDPLGSGYHIIQSKIAIGSGGWLGKGWLHGTQAHLAFLPEHATDFIFAVCGEELGLIGSFILLILYAVVIGRCLYISSQAQNTFNRLLAGSLSLMFFLSIFINVGMVTGLLPVVGLPLPLVSYGGTSIVTLCINFGIIMSIHRHRQLIGN